MVDENLRDQTRPSPTIGILLCSGRNDNVVLYSIAHGTAPLVVAEYPYDTLPAAERNAVPAADQLIAIAESTRRHLEPPSRYPSPDRAERAVPETPTQTFANAALPGTSSETPPPTRSDALPAETERTATAHAE